MHSNSSCIHQTYQLEPRLYTFSPTGQLDFWIRLDRLLNHNGGIIVSIWWQLPRLIRRMAVEYCKSLQVIIFLISCRPSISGDSSEHCEEHSQIVSRISPILSAHYESKTVNCHTWPKSIKNATTQPLRVTNPNSRLYHNQSKIGTS